MSAAKRTRRGFTLLELMVSLTVGGIAITSIYSIGATATRTFHQQQQIAAAQTSLRNAVDQVKRDVARAGFMFTPNAATPGGFTQTTCNAVGAPLHAPLVSGSLAAISRFVDDIPSNTANATVGVDPTGLNAANGFTSDSIVLFGNYETGSEYPGITLVSDTEIAIDQDWQSFQRDFSDWPNGNSEKLDIVRFNEAFTLNRLIRIQTTRRLRHFATITRVSAPSDVPGQNDVHVEFTPAIPFTCTAETTGGWVAPVSAIRYYVRDAPAEEGERMAGSFGPMAQLIRQEVNPNDKVTPLPDAANNANGNTRAILDFVVGFNLAFTMNGTTNTGAPDDYTAGALTGNLTDSIPAFAGNAQNIVNANPERVRAVSIEIAVRTPEQDNRLLWTQADCAGMRCFQVFPSTGTGAVKGYARVRRERADVFLPNVAYEGY